MNDVSSGSSYTIPGVGSLPGQTDHAPGDRDKIFFKGDRIYKHSLARFNYTTYDVRRSQDVVNPKTPHCDIMVLAHREDNHNNKSDSEPRHPFWYARVLGIFHANVVYTGPGMTDYMPRRLHFLWVQWFECMEDKATLW